MRELSVPEQPYRAVLAVISDGRTVTAAPISVTVRPSLITASTARYGCSGTLNSLIRECQGSTGTGVNHQPKPRKHQAEPKRQASTGTETITEWACSTSVDP